MVSYCRVINNEIVQTWKRKQKEFYIPEIDSHIKENEWELYNIYPTTQDNTSITTTLQKVVGKELKVVEGKPVYVNIIKSKTQTEIDNNLILWRDNVSCSMSSLRKALNDSNKMDKVNVFINSLSGKGKAHTEIDFKYSSRVRRSSSLILSIIEGTTLSDVQMDDIFILSITFDNV